MNKIINSPPRTGMSSLSNCGVTKQEFENAVKVFSVLGVSLNDINLNLNKFAKSIKEYKKNNKKSNGFDKRHNLLIRNKHR